MADTEPPLEDVVADLVAAMAPAMVVVTTVGSGGGGPEPETSGCLVGFHSQCGIEPLRYAVWLSRANHTCRVGRDAEHFAVHLLGRDDRDLARLFGTETGDEVDKLARAAWTPGPGGVPLLDGLPNRLVGRRVGLIDTDADHVGVVLEPVDASHPGLDAPLVLDDVTDLDPGHEATDR